jgi:hypothetical protein
MACCVRRPARSVSRSRRPCSTCYWDAWLRGRSGLGLLDVGARRSGSRSQTPICWSGGCLNLVRQLTDETCELPSSWFSGPSRDIGTTWSSTGWQHHSAPLETGLAWSSIGGGLQTLLWHSFWFSWPQSSPVVARRVGVCGELPPVGSINFAFFGFLLCDWYIFSWCILEKKSQTIW